MLYDEISRVLDLSLCDSEDTYGRFLKKLEERALTRDENPQTHLCVYFLPYNFKSKKVFIVHHKKSGLWLSPGGHIDKGEEILKTLNREIEEELGVKNYFQDTPLPFLFTIIPISSKIRQCTTHYDMWYLMHTDGANFEIDPSEFYDTKWMTLEEARKIIVDSTNLQALEAVARKY